MIPAPVQTSARPVLTFILFACIAVALAACGPTPKQDVPTRAELDADVPLGRLPQGVRPVHYDLDLWLDPRERHFGGEVIIDIELDEAKSGIWLHGGGLDVTDVSVSQAGIDAMGADWIQVRPGIAYLAFPRSFGPGEIEVTLAYHTNFDLNLSGLFKVEEQGRAYALAKSESIQARRFMPGFDEPRFKTPFDITLVIPEDMTAITNTPVLSEEAVANGFKRLVFKTTRPQPTYLLSLSVGEFEKVSAPDLPANAVRDTPVPLAGYTRPGKGRELSYALETTRDMIEFFETELQTPYPYEKLDIVAAPQWPSGATELAAAPTYRESRILFGESSGAAQRRALLGIHSHEIGHMWFGDLVTPPWWDDLWLKEGFASWGTSISLADLEPGGGYGLDSVVDSIYAMRLDSLSSARAVREPIELSENIRSAYDAITYDKGQAVIAMMDAYFGADRFRPALGRYVERFEDGVADSRDFFDVIAEETGEPDLTVSFRSFVEQSGVPLVSARLQCEAEEGATLEIRQSRYRPLGSAMESARSWTIPLCARTIAGGERSKTCAMFSGETLELSVPLAENGACPALVMPNAGGRGYWRFSLDRAGWARLTDGYEQLGTGEALVALDSAHAAFEAGELDIGAVMALVREGASRGNRRVIQQSMRVMSNLAPLATTPQARAGFRRMARSIFAPRLEALEAWEAAGNTLTEDETILKSRLERFLALDARAPALRNDLAASAASFTGLQGYASDRVLTSDDFATAITVAIQNIGAPMIERLILALDEIDDPALQQAAAYALGQNSDPELTPRLLDLALSGELGPRESYSIVSGQTAQPETRDLAWTWVQENFEAFSAVIPRQRRLSTPRLADALCYPAAADEVATLFEAHGDLVPGYERALSETVERIELCVALKDAKGDEATAYFSGP